MFVGGTVVFVGAVVAVGTVVSVGAVVAVGAVVSVGAVVAVGVVVSVGASAGTVVSVAVGDGTEGVAVGTDVQVETGVAVCVGGRSLVITVLVGVGPAKGLGRTSVMISAPTMPTVARHSSTRPQPTNGKALTSLEDVGLGAGCICGGGWAMPPPY